MSRHSGISDSDPSAEAEVGLKLNENVRKKILFVEDEATTIMVVSQVIKLQGYEVIAACSGENAIDMIKTDPSIDLVLMDIELGEGIDGTEAAKQILELRNLPVVFFTQHAEREIVEKVRGITRYGHVIKNSGDFVLLASIETALQLFDAHEIEARKNEELSETNRRLRESEERYRALAESAQDSIFIYDDRMRIVYINHHGQEKMQIPLKDLTGKDVSQVFPGDASLHMKLQMAQVLKTGKTFREEMIVPHPSGTRCEDVQLVPLFDRDGNAKSVMGIARDITEHMRAEEALRASEVQYRRLFESAKDGILILDAETGVIIDVNPFLMELLDYPREQFIGKKLWEMGFLRDKIVNQDNFHQLQRDECIRYDDIPLEASNGRKREVEFVSNAYFVNDRKVIQCNIRDITERKRAEEELKFRNILLRTQQESSIDGILVVDEKGSVISCNRRFVEMWNIPIEVIESKSDLQALHSAMSRVADPARFLEKVRYLYDQHHETSHDEILLSDGGVFDRYSAPMNGADGKYYGRVWYYRDITEQKLAEKEREKLQTQLIQAQKMESVGRLAGGVAHDFNNMLAVIIGNTEMIMNKTGSAKTYHEELSEILNAANRSADITKQLLAFARKQPVRPKILELNDAVSDTIKMLRRLITEDIDLVWKPGRAFWKVRVDPAQITQILTNLSVNARDAIAGAGTITIETENTEIDEAYVANRPDAAPGLYVMLAVSDNGVGMGREVLAHLFEPFFTTKETGKGTGLGLATVYGIVKQNNGFINVYSEPGLGTTFRIYLPRFIESGAEEPEKEYGSPQGGSETVLLVEDEEMLIKIARRILEELGYTVLTARTPNQAIRLTQDYTGAINLLITDIVLPEMNGKVLYEKLVSMRSNLKCLYMSGYTADVIAHRGVLDEGIHFLPKPYDNKALARKVREVIDS